MGVFAGSGTAPCGCSSVSQPDWFWFVLPKAWYALRNRRADMNLLMVFAVIGAVFLGEWMEAGMVAFLFAVSLQLEAWSVRRARHSIGA